MPDVKYTKGDLLWEATRRNQDYKNEYDLLSLKYRESHNIYNIYSMLLQDQRPSAADLSDQRFMWPTDRWAIAVWPAQKEEDIKYSPSKYFSFTGLIKLMNPSIDIYKIKKKISSGVPASDVHPYSYVDDFEQMRPLNYYHRIKQESFWFLFSKHKIGEANNICINENILGNNLLVIIPPYASDDSIKKAVLEARKMVVKGIKDELTSLNKKIERVFNPLFIKEYIGWLEKYDEIVARYIKLRGVESLTYDKGAVIIKDSPLFTDIVLDIYYDPQETTYEKHRKNYDQAYKGAVQLIQNTPNITFSPSRTKILSK